MRPTGRSARTPQHPPGSRPCGQTRAHCSNRRRPPGLGATPPPTSPPLPPPPPPPRQRRVGDDGPPGHVCRTVALCIVPPPRWARPVPHDPLCGVRACARQHHRPQVGWRRDRRGPASPTVTSRDGDSLISTPPPPRVGAPRDPPRPVQHVPCGVRARQTCRRGRLDSSSDRAVANVG